MKATIGVGGIKVHTIKLKRPKNAPIAVPAHVPSIKAVIITGIADSVATIGPNAGNEPSGVKQNNASIANNMLN